MSTSSAWKRIQTYFNVLNHCIVSIVVVCMTFFYYGVGNQLISWHVWLCSTGYQLLMAQAILALFSENVWSKQETRQIHKTLYWILQGLRSSVAIAGMTIESINKWQNSRNHFVSTHGILGLTAFILTLLGVFNGVSTLWSAELRTYVKPKYSKLAHHLTGITAFVLGMVTLYFGYDQGLMKENSREDIRMWLQAACIITILLTLFGALRSTVKSTRDVFS